MRRAGVLACVVAAVLVLCISPAHGGLYDNDGEMITRLDHKILTHSILASDKAWLVEFYASWCGHCQNYAKTFRAIAKDLGDWKGVVVAGIDCGAAENRDICGQYNIMGYPTLKYFPPHASFEDAVVISVRSVADVRKAVLKELMKTQLNPALHPPQTAEEAFALLESRSAVGTVAYVMDSDESDIGPELVMDFSAVPDLYVSYATEATQMTVGAKYDVSQFPCVLILGPLFPTPRILRPATANEKRWSTQIRQQLLAFIQAELHVQTRSVDTHNASLAGLAVGDSGVRVTVAATPKVYFTSVKARDVANAVTYALKHEVPIHGNLTGEALEALQAFTTALSRYLRLSAESETALYTLSEWLRGKSAVTKDMYVAFTDTWRIPEAREDEWDQCRGSKPQYRGYPCGLWSLFHTVTATATMEDEGLSDTAPRDVIIAVKGYVRHFFGCRECAGHFLDVAKNVEAELDGKQHGQSMLWLWQAHNRANVRLGGNPNDLSTDPLFPKLVFPPPEVCKVCRDSRDGDPLDFASWNLPTTLKFLLHFYTLTPQVDGGDSRQVMSSPDESEPFFNTQVLSFCVLLNICSALLCCRAYALRRATIVHSGAPVLPLHAQGTKRLYPV